MVREEKFVNLKCEMKTFCSILIPMLFLFGCSKVLVIDKNIESNVPKESVQLLNEFAEFKYKNAFSALIQGDLGEMLVVRDDIFGERLRFFAGPEKFTGPSVFKDTELGLNSKVFEGVDVVEVEKVNGGYVFKINYTEEYKYFSENNEFAFSCVLDVTPLR